MKNSTPIFPGFHLQTLRRKPRTPQQKLAAELAALKEKSFKQVGEIFERFIPHNLLKPARSGVMSRRRLFSKENTFWAFFSQIVDSDGGCKYRHRGRSRYFDILQRPFLLPWHRRQHMQIKKRPIGHLR